MLHITLFYNIRQLYNIALNVIWQHVEMFNPFLPPQEWGTFFTLMKSLNHRQTKGVLTAFLFTLPSHSYLTFKTPQYSQISNTKTCIFSFNVRIVSECITPKAKCT